MGKESKKREEKDKSEKSKKDHKHKSKHHSKDKEKDKERSKKHEHSAKEKLSLDGKDHISADDFFAKSLEFRVWLKIAKGTYFEDLISKEAHKIFEKEFVKDYNKGKLSSMYYDGNIPLEIKTSTVKSQHKWGLRLTKNEATQLADLTEDVDVQTRAPTNADKLGSHSSSMEFCRPVASNALVSIGPRSSGPAAEIGPIGPVGPAAGYSAASASRLRTDDERDREREQRGAHRQQQKATAGVLMDELLPGRETSGSREQKRDQKRAVGDAIHGAHRYKEEERDGLNIGEKTLLGGDSREEFRRMAERERQLKDRRVEKAQDRAKELLGKQEEREMAFMQKLGIDPSKGRITIAPREN